MTSKNQCQFCKNGEFNDEHVCESGKLFDKPASPLHEEVEKSAEFPPRVRGYLRKYMDDKEPYWFCPEQWEYAPFKHIKSYDDVEFVSLEEHQAILEEKDKYLSDIKDAWATTSCRKDTAISRIDQENLTLKGRIATLEVALATKERVVNMLKEQRQELRKALEKKQPNK